MTLRWEADAFRFQRRPSDSGPYAMCYVDLFDGDKVLRRIQLAASPTGRNLHVYVDGKRYIEEAGS